jgi:flagellar hook assembly protein FlgD/outer membrane protein OmpA-like peptidoglycan-associated protein
MQTRYTALFGALLFFSLCVPAGIFGQDYDPVPGGELLDRLRSPLFLATTENTAGSQSVSGDVVNPAASALKQRIHIDGSYAAIVGDGAPDGHAANLGVTVPTRIGVFTGSGNFAHARYDAMDLGTRGSVNASFAKDLYPSLLVGTGLRSHFGTGGGTSGFGIGLDLGLVHILGPVGFMPDLRWGLTVSQMGIGYKPQAGTTGSPGPFTPAADIQATLLETEKVDLVVHTGFSAPSFQNLRYRAGSQVTFFDRVSLNIGWDVDLLEQTEKDRPAGSLMPSAGISVRFNTGSGESAGQDETPFWNRSDIDVHTAWAPLYDDVWATGAGAQIALGVVDRTPPAIEVTYPEESYISPNNDGRSDDLLLPVEITDERYVLQWALEVRDTDDSILRRIENKEERPENEGFRNIIDRLLYVKKGVAIPDVIRWDGRTDGGSIAPDGTYSFTVIAVDDNGNTGTEGPFPVHVDNTPPRAEFLADSDGGSEGDSLIFSPNDDGIKDTLLLQLETSSEDLWTIDILDGDDTVVHTTRTESDAVETYEWDGRDNEGSLVPDGVYSVRISATDRAQNTTTERLNNIIVDTEPTPINLTVDISHFSPNGDGRRDTVTFTPDVPVTEGIREYELVIRDRDGRARRTRSGSDTLPEEWVFDGRDDNGSVLPEGSYRGELNLRYRHGNQPTARSPEIVLDVTAPRMSVRADTPVFSPNGDDNLDTVQFIQTTGTAPAWSATIASAEPDSTPVRSYSWSGMPVEQLEWDGRDDDGNRVSDGRYRYILTGEDQAGNVAVSPPVEVELDNRETPVYIYPTTDTRATRRDSGGSLPDTLSAGMATGRQTVEAFSPNNDGIQDTMYLATDISDSRGAERFGIEIMNESGDVIARVDGSGSPQRSYPWDGRDSTGSIAPDGTYRARLSVQYRHGNRPVALSPPFLLDTQPPRAAVAVADEELAFSPDGDGDKDTLLITQSSSEEPLWDARIVSPQNTTPVRTWRLSGQLQDIVWDGTDNQGEVVPDGEYYYEVAGIDEAGNSTVARTDVFRTDTRDIDLRLRLTHYAFSPNGDGVLDDVTFRPEANIDLTVSNWTFSVIAVNGESDAPVFTRSGQGSLEPVVWDGRTDSGRTAPDGEYRGIITAQPVQREEPVTVGSARTVRLDTVPPEAGISLSSQIISPNGDGRLDELIISQEASEEELWIGTITDENGREAGRWEWVGTPPERLRFAGLDTRRNRVPDGFYTYQLTATDAAGNTGESEARRFEIYTEETPLQFYAQQRAFSPNGDDVKDTLPLTAVVSRQEDLTSWRLTVRPNDDTESAVYSRQGDRTDLPDSFTWDGTTGTGSRAAEGEYRAELELEYRHGNVAASSTDPILLDVTPPRIEVEPEFTTFSPDGDDRRDTVTFIQTSESTGGWTGEITGPDGTVMRRFNWNTTVEDLEWDGTDRAGNTLPDGEYTYTVTGTDEAGNTSTVRTGPITLDTRPTRIFVTVSSRRFSPNGDGNLDAIDINLITNRTDGAEERIVEVLDTSGAVVRTFRSSTVRSRETIRWNGRTDQGTGRDTAPDGEYTVRYRVRYDNGARPEVDSPRITLDTTGPELSANLQGLPFSPDNDGLNDELTINLRATDATAIASWSFDILDRGNRPFYRFQGSGEPRRELIWDGRSSQGELVISAEDYPYRFTATDAVGNQSEITGVIPIDILVVRDGDLLRIQISNINFEPNSPALQLDPNTPEGAKNIAVLDRLVQVFDKYQSYRIRVEGHAVNVTQTEREEREELQPLSLARARTVREALIELGMAPDRISTTGRGGTMPVVPHTDLDNRWKNRRVEFILIR